MTREQVDAILERVRSWPEDRQEDAVRLLMAMEAEAGAPYILSDEERRDLEDAVREVERGEIATKAEVDAVFARFRG